jgi:hypothetical protein
VEDNMQAVNIPILTANKLYGKVMISEEACKQMVEDFNKSGNVPVPLPLTFFNTQMPLGKIVFMAYDEDLKTIYADVELNLEVYACIDPIQKIDLPLGEIKVVEGKMRSGIIVPKVEGGK